ncbi:MAG: precorrin-6y C5,15-methyltransferase (decarboxylating) subunit CbiE [Cyanobacteria bacterium P01_G01_bin.67]
MGIAVVGIGLDGEKGLSLAVQKVVHQATVIAGGKRHLAYFPYHSARKICLTNLSEGINQVSQLDLVNHSLVILASGDPLFFGLGRLLLEHFDSSQIQFYPHFSSIQLAFNRLKIPWQDALLISAHGRSNDQLIKSLKQGKEKIAILTDHRHHPAAIARLYLTLDLPVNYSFYICENLGDTCERIVDFTPDQIPQLSYLNSKDFAALNVLILLRENQQSNLNLADLPVIGLPDSSFLSFSDRPSLITKKEIRLNILGELALQANQTVWDLGAGTGSVSIEIARLCPNSQVYAVEKSHMGSTLISKNIQRFDLNNVKSINGKAPEVLLNLPKPDRIFIGGSGGYIVDILDVCAQKLLPKGIVVMAFTTIEYQYQGVNWLNNNAWHYRLLQLQLSRSIPISHLTRLTPLNPITLIIACRSSS